MRVALWLAAGAFAVLAMPADQTAAGTLRPGATFRDCEGCPALVVLPAGTFVMGSTPQEREREGVAATFAAHEATRRTITFTKPFAIATTETTRGQYAQFVRETRRPLPSQCATYNAALDNWAGVPGQVANWQNPGFIQDDNHPVVCVSYDDAADYAAWLSRKTGHRYRVPSEAEWEYAARAGTVSARPWGDGVAAICSKAHIMTSATFAAIAGAESQRGELMCADNHSWTMPVASFAANRWGVFDMLGNVWEWVADCPAGDHAGLPTHGSAQVSGGDCSKRLSKGGAFHSRVWLARPATRGGGQSKASRPVAAGIRVVRDID